MTHRLVTFVLILAGVASDGKASAQEPELPTTHQAAACATAPDQPICFLRLAASSPLHLPYRDDTELGSSEEVLEALGDADTANERRILTGENFAGVLLVPDILRRRAVIAAMRADAEGAPPQTALEPIREMATSVRRTPMFAGQFFLESGEQLRRDAYEEIWTRSYSGAEENRPSAGIARAALAGWEAELKAGAAREDDRQNSNSPYDLAVAYGSIGDAAGVKRAVRLADRPKADQDLRAMLALGQMEQAIAAAARVNLDRETLHLLVKAGRDGRRTDLAVTLAEAALARELREKSIGVVCYPYCPPLIALLQLGSTEQVAEWAERLDAASRANKGIGGAQGAALAWTMLKEPERARAVVQAWATKGVASAEDVGTLLALGGMYDEAFRIPAFRPQAALRIFWSIDPDVVRLTPLLERARTPSEKAELLGDCVMRGDWGASDRIAPAVARADARTCADQLLALPLAARTSTMLSGGDDSAAAAISRAAVVAAQSGDLTLSREMLGLALEAWRDAPTRPLSPIELLNLERIARAELRATRRLSPVAVPAP